MSKINSSQPDSSDDPIQSKPITSSARERLLAAALYLFREHGFSGTSMLDIVTRARISKRDLYVLFKNKRAVLAACITERAQQMRQCLDSAVPAPQSRDELATMLVEFGVSLLKTVCDPEVLTLFRLAIAESDRAPEIGRALDSSGREANQKALIELIRKAQAQRLVAAGDPDILAGRYFAVLVGGLQLQLLLRVRQPLNKREIESRASAAAKTVMTFP
jgi:AcrR family transcriptional regulator